jgi:hypothetical protein
VKVKKKKYQDEIKETIGDQGERNQSRAVASS